MWFKNLSLFRLSEPFSHDAQSLSEALEVLRFRPCAPHEANSYGWTAPLNNDSQSLVHASNGFFMVCVRKQEKVLPMPVVNEMLEEKATELEDQKGHKLSKKERTSLKDELIFDLLPQAFTFSKKIYAYIDPKGAWIVVDSASSKAAEDVLTLLRKSLGSLPAYPVNTVDNPVAIMTHWLATESAPDGFVIEDECELRSPGEEASIIRCKRQDLTLPEIKNHLDMGKEVIKIALNWSDRLSFIIDNTFAIKRLKFLDLVQDQLQDLNIEDEASRFDADFAIMSTELTTFLTSLLAVFGGEKINQ